MDISDDDLLMALRGEAQHAVGFEYNSSSLSADRATAAEYAKGEMDDMPTLDSRSGFTTIDVADAVESITPELIDTFMDPDAVAFQPASAADEAAAEQETDYVRNVFFNENNGYELLYTAIKDALLMKTGYWMWQWIETPPDVEHFENKSQEEHLAAILAYGGEDGLLAVPGMPAPPPKPPGTPHVENVSANEDGTYNYDIVTPRHGRLDITAWPSEDVAVSEDTVLIGDGTYCAFRTRILRGQLLADGYDADIVSELPAYSFQNAYVEQARDQAAEAFTRWGAGSTLPLMDRVEVVYHFIRIPDADGVKIHRVVTSGTQAEILLSREIVDSVPAAGICPYPNPHRHFGLSVADKIIPLQRVMTQIIRQTLDHNYFAMSQRLLVAETAISPNTFSDIENNVPGAVIRVEDPEAVRPIEAGSMNFDPLRTLEQIKVMAEERTGIVRGNSGLSSESLHESVTTSMTQLSNAQRRIRSMAKGFAEMGLRPMFLGIHDTLRRNANMPKEIRSRGGQWVAIAPSQWDVREQMAIDIGSTHGGRDWDIAMLRQQLDLANQAVEAQGGPSGPLTNPNYLLALVSRLATRSGIKGVERYWPAPGSWTPPQPPQGPPPPSPEMVKAQSDAAHQQASLQLAAQKHQDDHTAAMTRIQADAQNRELEIRLRHEREMLGLQVTAAQRAGQVAEELDLKRQEVAVEAQLQAAEIAGSHDVAKAGLVLQAQDQAHAQGAAMIDMAHSHLMAAHAATQAAKLPPVRPGGEADE